LNKYGAACSDFKEILALLPNDKEA
jgi:Skp family chaperone for outer membrane proteins